MDAAIPITSFEAEPLRGAAYDPRNLHPLDEEDRKHDDASTDLDWDEIIATTQDDWEAGRYCFSTEDYATHEEGMVALRQWVRTITEEVLDEAASATQVAASRP